MESYLSRFTPEYIELLTNIQESFTQRLNEHLVMLLTYPVLPNCRPKKFDNVGMCEGDKNIILRNVKLLTSVQLKDPKVEIDLFNQNLKFTGGLRNLKVRADYSAVVHSFFGFPCAPQNGRLSIFLKDISFVAYAGIEKSADAITGANFKVDFAFGSIESTMMSFRPAGETCDSSRTVTQSASVRTSDCNQTLMGIVWPDLEEYLSLSIETIMAKNMIGFSFAQIFANDPDFFSVNALERTAIANREFDGRMRILMEKYTTFRVGKTNALKIVFQIGGRVPIVCCFQLASCDLGRYGSALPRRITDVLFVETDEHIVFSANLTITNLQYYIRECKLTIADREVTGAMNIILDLNEFHMKLTVPKNAPNAAPRVSCSLQHLDNIKVLVTHFHEHNAQLVRCAMDYVMPFVVTFTRITTRQYWNALTADIHAQTETTASSEDSNAAAAAATPQA